MTFLTSILLGATLGSGESPNQCTVELGSRTEQRAFTNADLERLSPCRYQTGVQSEPGTDRVDLASPRGERGLTAKLSEPARRAAAEADWRARWRSVDQKVRRLRLEARDLRQEAAESPRDPKKRVVGRRAPSLLIARAQALENEVRELTTQFDEQARREGALPGWIRPEGR